MQTQLFHSDDPDRARDFPDALAEFETFPYQRHPFAARNWGHALHSLCSYPSKMKPGLAATLIRLFTQPGDTVLDPFCGVGTVPFEAAMAGRHGVAVDLSPFAVAVAAAKVDPPSPEASAALIDSLAAYIDASPEADPSFGEPEIADFYHPDTWEEVLKAQRFFREREAAGRVGPDHWFVKSCVLHILHGNRPYALSRRSHGIIPIPPKGPTVYKSLVISLRAKADRMDLRGLPPSFVPGYAVLASAKSLPLPDGSVDAIITSPPFLGSTDFIRQNRLRLWFCGMNYAQQLTQKRGSEFLEGRRDLDGYDPILRELARVLRPGGLVIFHLGVVRGRDMAVGLRPLAEEVGYSARGLVYEDAGHLESHGRTARGGTAQHQYLFLSNDTGV